MIDLTPYGAIQTSLFVSIDVPDYDVLTFSDYNRPITIDSVTYTGLGSLVAISDSTSSLRSSPGDLTITISGIPNSSIAEILNNKIKGSSVVVWRMVFDPTTGQKINITGNPAGRFRGIVSNYSLEEDWNTGSQTASNTILLTCASTVEILSNKISGRRTNPVDQNALYPSDLSMDRVPTLANSNFNFGAVIK
jgi:hypothetical protein